MDATTLRIILGVVGALVLGLIWWTGRRPASPQGRRVSAKTKATAERAEPQLGAARDRDLDGLDPDIVAELDRLGREIQGDDRDRSEPELPRMEPAPTQSELAIEQPSSADDETQLVADASVPVASNLGARIADKADRIVTIYVAAPEGHEFAGSDIIVALEKTGLVYGALGAFHRLPSTASEFGAIFSVVNMLRPGHFEMPRIQSLRTPGLSLFMVLPNAQSALDAWDAMLPTAQRLAELLNGNVLDEERNSLNRQRIQYIRDDLRAYDRAQEKNTIRKTW
jgi:cell division protein ZipA